VNRDTVVEHFIARWSDIIKYNWGTAPDNHLVSWVDDDTYINGVVMTLDGDFYMGYLLEVVERTSSQVHYVAIALFHGPHRDTGYQDRAVQWYGKDVGTFFDRNVRQDAMCHWAVHKIYEMWDAKQKETTAAFHRGEFA
jgi:hypothetical protein